MALPFRSQPQENGSHVPAPLAGTEASLRPNGITSQSPDIPDNLQADDYVENGTVGSGTLSGSSVDDDDEFPPLIPGPDGIHVFIERDYRFTPRLVFPEIMPSDLLHIEGLRVDQPRFEALIRKLNVIYSQTEHVGCMSVIETLTQMVSCYTSLLCCRSQYMRYIDEADRAIAHANDEWRRSGVPLFMLSPRERGMRCLELIAMPPLVQNASTLSSNGLPMPANGSGHLHSYLAPANTTTNKSIVNNVAQTNSSATRTEVHEIVTHQPPSNFVGSNGRLPSFTDGKLSSDKHNADNLPAKSNSLRSEHVGQPHNTGANALRA